MNLRAPSMKSIVAVARGCARGNQAGFEGVNLDIGDEKEWDWPRECNDWDETLSFRNALVGIEGVRDSEPVRRFMERYLPDGPLPDDHGRAVVEAWVQERAEEANAINVPPSQGPAERLGLEALQDAMCEYSRREPPGIVPDPSFPMTPLYTPMRLVWPSGGRVDRLHFPRILDMKAPPYGAVGELFWLGLHLQDQYGWDPRYARGWVIADGAVPWTFSFGNSPDRPQDRSKPRPPGIENHRIVIDVAAEIPLDRIAALIKSRREALIDERPELKLSRPIARVILEATFFAAQRNDGRAWEDVLEEWNAYVSDRSWRYETGREGTRRFAKDVRRTYKALLGRAMNWKRGPGKTRRQ